MCMSNIFYYTPAALIFSFFIRYSCTYDNANTEYISLEIPMVTHVLDVLCLSPIHSPAFWLKEMMSDW